MLIRLIFLLLISIHSSSSVYKTLSCDFADGPFYSIVGNAYQCKVKSSTAIKSDSVIIDNINGIHYDMNSNRAVIMLWVWATIFHYIPQRLGVHFPNLEAIWIHHGGLKVLKYDTMKQFAELRYIYAGYNHLEVLAPNVFKGNKKIEWIDLQNNRLKYVDGEIFTAYPLLQNLNLVVNYCINEHHYGKVGHLHLGEIKDKIDKNCHLPTEIYCELQEMSHQGANYYTCSGKGTAINEKNVKINRILLPHSNQTHEATLNRTQGLHIRYQNFTHFPINLHEFLPNLIAIQIIGCRLQELNAEDLMNFPNLKSLWLPLNHIEVLKNDVFEHTLKLEKLSLYGNKLWAIESDVLQPLQYLKFVSFEKNKCVDKAAEGVEIYRGFKREVSDECKEK